MAAKADSPDHRVFLVIAAPGPGPLAVYLVATASGWSLPEVVVPLPHGVSYAAAPVTAAVRDRFDLDTELLLCLAAFPPAHDRPAEAVVQLGLAPATQPPQPLLRRVTLDAARSARWARADHRVWLDVLDEPHPPQRMPWAQPGFLLEAEQWITAELSARGLAATGALEVRRNWSITALLRVPTAAGDFYFKAVPPLFGQEPVLTQYLGQRFPGRVPEVVALDVDRHWLLMRAFAGEPLTDQTAPDPWIDALRGYAELQVALVPDAPGLLDLGCPDRRASVLEGQVGYVLSATEAMLIDQPRGLPAADVARLQALEPALRQACRAFAALPLPATLEHGDLHGGNIVLAPSGGFVYYDWSDGCLAPPFFGLPTYLEVSQADLHPALIDAYAAPWRAYAEDATLRRARLLARPLSDLHIGLSYVLIHAQTEPRQRWQLDGSLPYFLRQLLQHWSEVEPQL